MIMLIIFFFMEKLLIFLLMKKLINQLLQIYLVQSYDLLKFVTNLPHPLENSCVLSRTI